MDVANAFGTVLRELRKKRGLTQEQLGLEADIRRTYVSLLELGRQQPTLTTVLKLAGALGTSGALLIAMVEKELGHPPQRRR